MREIPSSELYPRPEPVERLENVEYRTVPSLLRGPDGEVPEIRLGIAQDGKLRRLNFWDLDKTLLYSQPVQLEAALRVFPDITDEERVKRVFEAGWRLGTSFREWDRMFRIFREGRSELEDPELYRKEFIADKAKAELIDKAGHPEGLHERAAPLVKRFGESARDIIKEFYEKDPKFLQGKDFLNLPLKHLLEAKSRLGEGHVFMTANPRVFADALIQYTGLYKYGLSMATDETMAAGGGGKEVAIPQLMEEVEALGVEIPPKRLVALGDSEHGDLGSGFKVMKKSGGEFIFQGVLVRKDMKEAEAFKAAVVSDPDLREMAEQMEITLVESADVPRTKSGGFKLGRLGSIKKEKPADGR